MHNGIIKPSFKSHCLQLLLALFAVIFMALPAMAQTQVPGQGNDPTNGNVNLGTSPGANGTDPTAQDIYDSPGQASLVQQQAEQDIPAVAQNVEQKLWPDFGAYNQTYEGLAAFWGDDIISNFFANIGQLIGKWLAEFINGWVADAVQFLTGFLRIFVLNPNIAVNGLADNANGNNAAVDDISPYIRQGADVMFSIAIDILLLLFVLCIWKFWTEAAWRGGGNMMGAVGRLIATAGLLLCWPTIYAFEVQITNEMIKAIYFNSADQVAMLDAAMAAAVKGGLVAGAGLLANATAPVAGQVLGGVLAGGVGGVVLGTVGGIIAFVGLMIYLILGGILVAELVYILVLKAIQTALLCAQYMFAPFFLVFFALPDTESVATGFVRSFVEVSLWTFVWVGMLKIMVIIILSDFNPWGKIVMAVGVLQLMIQVPTFLARAQISPMSDFISAGLITGGLLSGGKALADTLGNRAKHFANAVGNFGYAGAKGSPKSQTVEMNGLANEVANPGLLKDIRQAGATGQVPPKNDPNKKKPGDGTGTPTNPSGQPLNPAGGAAKKPGEENKKPGEEGQKLGPDGKPLDPAAAAAAKKAGEEGLGVTPPVKPPGSTDANAAGTGTNAAKGATDALATAGKTMAAAGALGAVAAAAGTPGSLSTSSGDKNDEANRSAQLSAQQSAEAAKALANAANTDGIQRNPDGSPKLGPDGQPLKAIVPPTAGEKKDKDGNVIKDPTQVSAVPGKDGAGANANAAGNVDGKGKDLNAASASASDLAKGIGLGAAAGGLAAAAAAKLPGDEVEVHGEGAGNPEGKTLASATIPGLKGTGLTGAGDKATGTPGLAGGDATKTSINAGKQDGTGAVLDVSKGDATLVAKPGAAVAGAPNDKGIAPGLSATADKLAAANAAITSGKGLDATTVVATEDEVLNPADPGAPLVTKGGGEGTFSNGKSVAGAGTGVGVNTAGDTKIEASATGRIIPPTGPQTGVDGKTIVGGPNASVTGTAAGAATNANGQAVVGQNVNAELRGAGGQTAVGTTGGVAAGSDLTTVEEVGHDGNAANAAALGLATAAGAVIKGGNQTLTPPVAGAVGNTQVTGADKLGTPPLNTAAPGAVVGGPASLNATGALASGQTAQQGASVVGAEQKVDATLRPGATTGTGASGLNTAVPTAGGTAELTEEGGQIDPANAALAGAAAATVTGTVKSGQQAAVANSAAVGAGHIDAATGRLVPPPLGSSANVNANNNGAVTTAGAVNSALGTPPVNTSPVTGAANTTLDATVKPGAAGQAVQQQHTQNQGATAEVEQDGADVIAGATGATTSVSGAVKAGQPPVQTQNQSAVAAVNGQVNAAGGRFVPPPLGSNAGPTPVNAVAGATTATGQASAANGLTPPANATVDTNVRPGANGQTVQQAAAAGNIEQVLEEVGEAAAVTGALGTVTGTVRQQVPPAAMHAGGTPTSTTTNTAASANRIPSPPSATNNLSAGSVNATVTPGTGAQVTANAAPPSQFAATSGGTGSAPAAARIAGDMGGGGDDGGGGGGGDGDDAGPIYTGPGGPPTGPSSAATSPKSASMFDNYMQAGYRHVPYRMAAASIRLAQGATLGVSKSGRPENVYDSMGHLMHVRFGEGASDEQKGMQIIAGAYGELMSSDAEAYDAARQSAIDAGEHKPQGMAERAAAGILAYNGSSWTQTAAAKQRFGRSMAKHAALGSQAYVNGEPGNAYTEHLVNRYGPMSEEQQAWASYIMTNSDSPESGWSFRMGPATEALIQNGVPISSVSRAVAANPSVLKAQPWLRGAAIRGGIEYMSARADSEIPEGTNALVRDAWMGNRAQAVAPEIVNAIGALTLAGATDADGNSACRDFGTVDKVAAMVGANGRPEDYVGAYNSLRGGSQVVARMQANFAGGGGGGGSRSVSLPSQTVSMGGGGGGGYGGPGGVSMGGVSMSGGGAGPAPTNMADVDVFLDGGGTSNAGMPNINANQIPLSGLPGQQGGSTIVNARVQAGSPPSSSGNLGNIGKIQAPGANVGSASGQIQIGRIDMPSSGGGQSYTENATVDVETSVSGQIVDYDDPRAAVTNAISQYGGSQNLVKQVVAELRSHGVDWNQIYDPSKADSDPGKYQMLETAVQAYAQNPASMGAVAVAAKAVGGNNVSLQDVEVVQQMFDADPSWNEKNVDYGAVYTARAISQAHDSNPQEYGKAYLSKDYVDSIRQDPRFTPRPIPVRNRTGAVARYDQSPVPKDRLVKRVFERMMGQDGYNNGNG